MLKAIANNSHLLDTDVNKTYIRSLADILDVFLMPYLRSIYVLCPYG